MFSTQMDCGPSCVREVTAVRENQWKITEYHREGCRVVVSDWWQMTKLETVDTKGAQGD